MIPETDLVGGCCDAQGPEEPGLGGDRDGMVDASDLLNVKK
jgi:hypothetical protein